MKNKVLISGLTAMSAGALFAVAPAATPAPTTAQPLKPEQVVVTPVQPSRWSFDLSQGYRHDKVTTSIAGKHHHPSTVSHLIWKHLDIYQTRLGTRWNYDSMFADLNLGYGDVRHGRFTDNDYAKSGNKLNFSRSSHPVRDSYTVDAKIAFGQYFDINNTFSIAPRVGYTWDYMRLKMEHGHIKKTVRNGFIVHSDRHVHNLSSKYHANFDSPFIGVEAQVHWSDLIQFMGRYDFSFFLKEHNRGYWNKRHMYLSEHTKRYKGYGHDAAVGVNFALSQNLSLKAEYEYSWQKAQDGQLHVRIHDYKAHTPVNHSRWTSSEARLTLTWAL